jgi:hypothetical protein
MISFLFWNINRKPLKRAISNLARRHSVDLVILAESEIPNEELIDELNRGRLSSQAEFEVPDSSSLCERITIVPRCRPGSMIIKAESAYYTVRRIRLPKLPELLLAAVHLPSKLYASSESQTTATAEFGREIRDFEEEIGHRRTLLVGDFNMNPFESGLIAAEGLNAVMTRQIAIKNERTVRQSSYPFFYNPMWSHFGDSTHLACPPGHDDHETAGTCYYSAKESCWYFWNMYDQVLLRPDLLSSFRNETLKILVTDGESSFVNKRGLPSTERFSDHLPITFRLDL